MMQNKRSGRRRAREAQAFATRIAEAFGERLQQVRKKAGWKQDAFAEALGVSRTTASNIERGKQRIFLDQVFRSAEILKVPIDSLLPPLDEIHSDIVVRVAADDRLSRSAEQRLTAVLRELSALTQSTDEV